MFTFALYTSPLSVQADYQIAAGPPHHSYSVKVKVTLRLTVSQSVSLGIEPHLGLMTRYYYSLTVMVLFCGAPSLTRGWVCLLYMLLALAR
jgi:hypothetical protein